MKLQKPAETYRNPSPTVSSNCQRCCTDVVQPIVSAESRAVPAATTAATAGVPSLEQGLLAP
eukprot:9518003-Alexandrium_andersonii.AAC.1